MTERLGILGGTFNPIHLGHLIIASYAADELELDRVLLMPAQTPPHKPDTEIIDAAHRAAMVRVAIADDPRLAFSDMDMLRAGPSYTVDLLERVREESSCADVFFIIGADSLRDFPSWHRPDAIIRLARLAVARRPGVVVDAAMLDALPGLRQRVALFDSPLIEISSTEIRDRAARDRSITWLVPPAVERYIYENGLYGTSLA